MDLTEVEGLADLLAADTTAQRRQVGGGQNDMLGPLQGRRGGGMGDEEVFESLREVEGCLVLIMSWMVSSSQTLSLSSSLVQALRQMGGSLRVTYDGWREELKRCLAHTEAVIDFADVRDCPHPRMIPTLFLPLSLVSTTSAEDGCMVGRTSMTWTTRPMTPSARVWRSCGKRCRPTSPTAIAER